LLQNTCFLPTITQLFKQLSDFGHTQADLIVKKILAVDFKYNFNIKLNPKHPQKTNFAYA
jgi:hypothetical protein